MINVCVTFTSIHVHVFVCVHFHLKCICVIMYSNIYVTDLHTISQLYTIILSLIHIGYYTVFNRALSDLC